MLDDAGEAPDGDTECRARWLTAVRLGVRMMRQGTRRAFSGNDPILAPSAAHRPQAIAKVGWFFGIACRNEWERQGLLIIAEQCERLAAYKDLTAGPFPITAPAKDELKVAAHPRGTARDGESPDLLVAKP